MCMTTLHIGHVGLEGSGLVWKLSACLMMHVWPKNPEVTALGVDKHLSECWVMEMIADRNLRQRKGSSEDQK